MIDENPVRRRARDSGKRHVIQHLTASVSARTCLGKRHPAEQHQAPITLK